MTTTTQEGPVLLEKLPISVRLFNTLIEGKRITTIEELLEYSPGDLLRIKGFGQRCLNELREVLSERDLKLKDDTVKDDRRCEYEDGTGWRCSSPRSLDSRKYCWRHMRITNGIPQPISRVRRILLSLQRQHEDCIDKIDRLSSQLELERESLEQIDIAIAALKKEKS